MGEMFGNCTNLTSIDISNFDVRNVESMLGMFEGCIKLTSLDISNFKTEKLEDASFFLNGTINLKYIDLRRFNTKNLKNKKSFFHENPDSVTLIYNKSIFDIQIPSNWNAKDVGDNFKKY